MTDADTVNVRYLVDDVAAAVDFYTRTSASPSASTPPRVRRRHPRQPAAAAVRSAELGRRPMTDGERPGPGRMEPHPPHRRRPRRRGRPPPRRRACGSATRSSTGPGGAQVLAHDPSGNLVELFQPAARSYALCGELAIGDGGR